jgi:hypothetical protein
LCVAGGAENLLSIYQHSNFINDVAYISGFIIRKIIKKNVCDKCSVEIEVRSSESKLLDRKNRGGLIKASHDVVQICKIVKTFFRSIIKYN